MLYLVLIMNWPLINYLNANFDRIYRFCDVRDVFILFFVLVSVAALAHMAAKKILKQSTDKLILPMFLSVVLFFVYSDMMSKIFIPLSKFGGGNFGIFFYRRYYFYLFIFVSTVYFAWKVSSKSNFRKLAKILVCVVFTLSAANLTKTIIVKCCKNIKPEKNLIRMEKLSFQFQHKPNVYYILVDAYGRQDYLWEFAGYNNEPFLKKLEEKGFIVSRSALSNYHFTNASLSSMMDMAYHMPGERNGAKLIDTALMRQSLLGKNKVREVFRKNGYYVVNVPAFENEIGCCGNEDSCIDAPVFFGSQLVKSFFSATPLGGFFHSAEYISIKSIRNIYNIVPNKPKFVFVHIAQIHDLALDEFGNIISGSKRLIAVMCGNKANHYIHSIMAVNSEILAFVDHVKAQDPGSIIIVQADHGGAERVDENCKKKNVASPEEVAKYEEIRYFGIFSAIYLPNYDQNRYKKAHKYFSGFFTLINTFRYVFAYLSDKEPLLLPEKSQFLFRGGREGYTVYPLRNG